MNTLRPRSADLGSPHRRLKTPAAVALWRPEIVLATTISPSPAHRAVTLAEPSARPEAVRTQLGTTRWLLGSLADARESLGAAAAAAHARAEGADTARAKVSAMFAAYRAEAALDDILTGTWHQVSALMEERGLR
jgi:hypothetical protein